MWLAKLVAMQEYNNIFILLISRS